MSKASPSNEVVSFMELCLDKAKQNNIEERITLYRGLAKTCGDEVEARELNNLAEELMKHEIRFRDFVHSFSQRSKGGIIAPFRNNQ